jgi:hypothetical protein
MNNKERCITNIKNMIHEELETISVKLQDKDFYIREDLQAEFNISDEEWKNDIIPNIDIILKDINNVLFKKEK